ncbi:MAG TPA: zf-HC2 domain-containing protein [Myxococcales bacterium]|nr:zf-HC2 domain-containing protein [Myxococcales bacterium]
MKRCEDVVPLIGPLLDGALPPDDRAWVEEHVLGCEACTRRRALLRAQAQALRDALQARAAALSLAGFSDRVLARVRADAGPRAREQARVWGQEMWWAHRGVLTAGSGLALAACMALFMFFQPPASADDGPALADNSPQVEEVDFGTHDGAVLQLGRETTVIWMSDDRVVQR